MPVTTLTQSLHFKMKNKHPYYDSDKKKRTEEFAMKAVAICFVSLLVILIIGSIVKAIG